MKKCKKILCAIAVMLPAVLITGLSVKDKGIFNMGVETVYADTWGDWEYEIEYEISEDEDWNETVEITGYNGKETEVVIPGTIDGKSVTRIGNAVFYDCSSLTSIKIPNSVTSIGWNAFRGCSSLTSIEIPSGVTSIGESAFSGCSSLTSVEIPSRVTSIGSGAFSACNSLTSIEIPSDVTSIKKYTFSSCSSLTSIKIPSNVTSIEKYAFYGCSSLTSIEIPSGVTSIEENAFYGCSSLTSIKIPNGVTSIGSEAFYGCSSLTSIEVPSGVTSITGNAFRGCSSLTNIEIPSGVTSIMGNAFSDCSSLTSIEIPSGVTSIMGNAFSGCNSLTDIYVEENSQSYTSKDGILYDKSCKTLICCPGGKQGTITIPDSVTSIGSGAFVGCSSLTSIKIPNSVTSIGGNAFRGCSSLTSIKIPSSVTSIEYAAFYYCRSLMSIEIPSSVTSIEITAFWNCSSNLTIHGEAASYAEKYAKENGIKFICLHHTPVLDPAQAPTSTETGKTEGSHCSVCGEVIKAQEVIEATGHTEVSDPAASGDWKYKILWDGTVEITGYNGRATQVSIPGTIGGKKVTSIGICAFEGCSSLTSVTIPNSVKKIGMGAFSKCSNLTSITIPSSVTEMGGTVFLYSNNMTSINVAPGSTTYASKDGILYDKAFTKIICCPNGKEGAVSIPEGVKAIWDCAFGECNKLTSITVPSSVKTINWLAFEGTSPDLILYGKSGSYIEKYAKENGMKFSTHKMPTHICKLSKTSFTYNGKNQKPTVTVKDSKGNKLSADSYTITYPKTSKKVGKYTITVTLKDNYSGTIKRTYQIKPKSTTISKLTAKKKGFTVKWKKQTSQTTGYQIQYSTSSKFKGAKTVTVKKNKTTSKSITKLKAGKKYYVRIRTYKNVKVNGKNTKIYSGWSKVKSVKTKK